MAQAMTKKLLFYVTLALSIVIAWLGLWGYTETPIADGVMGFIGVWVWYFIIKGIIWIVHRVAKN